MEPTEHGTPGARDQRGHYYRVTASALATVLKAWLLMTLSTPPGTHRLPRAHRLTVPR